MPDLPGHGRFGWSLDGHESRVYLAGTLPVILLLVTHLLRVGPGLQVRFMGPQPQPRIEVGVRREHASSVFCFTLGESHSLAAQKAPPEAAAPGPGAVRPAAGA